MFSQKSWNIFFALMMSLTIALAGCGGANQAASEVDEAAPLAVEEVVVVEEAVAEEPVAEAVPEAEFDLTAAVDDYMSGIPAGFMAVNLDSFKEILDTGEAVVIDVREVKEYDEGHIPGAINIPLRELAQNLDQIPADKPVIVHCASGHRAGLATSALQILGYDNVRSFAPSYKAWVAAEEPVETEPVEAAAYDVPEMEPELVAAVDDFLTGIPEGFLAMGDIEKLNEAMDNGAFLVDVRETGEFEAGHIPGAINIPIRTLAQNVDQIPADQPVFVYCKSGHRAALSTGSLQTLGLDNVKSFPPGFAGWDSAGQPIAAAQ